MELFDHAFLVGDWLVEPQLHRLTHAGESMVVEPKMMQVLVCLAERPGQLVDRGYLLEKVWEETIVTEHVLNRSISQLRKVFGDNPKNPAFIETISKAGYRLIAPVQSVPSPTTLPHLPTSDGHAPDIAPEAPAAIDLTISVPPHEIQSRKTRSPKSLPLLVGALVLLTAISTYAVLILARPSSPVGRVLESIPLTTYTGLEVKPAFSPDGKQIAFSWAGPEQDNIDIYIKLPGTETPLRLTDHPDRETSPTWSPDGRHLVFRRLSADGCGLFIVPSLGGPERKLTDCKAAQFGLSWSPEGQWLAVGGQEAPGEPYGLFLIAYETLERKRITTPPELYQVDYGPKFSPDGKQLAFLRSSSRLDFSDIYVMPTLGEAEPKRITFDNRFMGGMDWTPDGQSIIFSSSRAGNFRLWRIPAGGGEPAHITSINTYDPGGLAVARQGELLAYEEWFYEMNIWSAPTAPSDTPDQDARHLITSTRWDFHPAFSPDGQSIAFISNRSGSYELWVCDRVGQNLVRLTSFNDAYLSTPRWSPDGKQLVFDAHTADQADLYVLNAEGGVPRRLTTHSANDVAPSWSGDGQWVYFASSRSGTWQLWKIALGGGEAVQLTKQGGFVGLEAPAGDRLYYSKYDEQGLWSRPLEGGPETRVLDTLDPRDWGNWAVTKKGIYFIERSPTDARIALFDFSTGATTLVHSLTGKSLSAPPGLSVDPDSEQILYTLADRVESDIMYVKDFR